MWGSVVVYAGALLAAAGAVLVFKPIARFGIGTRRRALTLTIAGLILSAVGLRLPVSETRVGRAESRLDEFTPAWQFREKHSIAIAAPPARVYDALRSVRADEIFLFHTLTWLRRGGRPMPRSILDAGAREPLIDVATSGGFVRLVDDAPRELLMGVVVLRPPGAPPASTPDLFRAALPPGYARATMNFLVKDDGAGGSVLSTETRVFAADPDSRRRFASYWRVIYPGSALIRRTWLRAIARRAAGAPRQDAP
jgi:hypothetical protein